MKTVGKKKKRKKVYYVKQSRSKSMLPLLLIGGGVAAYFLMNKSAATDTTTPVTTPVIGPVDTDGGTTPKPPAPVITIPTGAQLPALDTASTTMRTVLLRDMAAYNDVVKALKVMNSQEIYYTYQYVYGYFLPNKRLYRDAWDAQDNGHPGDWNTDLYDYVQYLHGKYGIF